GGGSQPHTAQDAGGDARGDAGAARHRRRRESQIADPFFVLATQNPVEQEGTYPLPEAQLDRFMFMIYVDYPSPEEELEIMRRGTGTGGGIPRQIIEFAHILYLQAVVRRMPVGVHVFRYGH